MAELTEFSINYSLGLRANLGNWEHADIHVSRSERWDVKGMAREDVDDLFEARRRALKELLDPLVEGEYNEVLGKK